jgi:hypothetical protein
MIVPSWVEIRIDGLNVCALSAFVFLKLVVSVLPSLLRSSLCRRAERKSQISGPFFLNACPFEIGFKDGNRTDKKTSTLCLLQIWRMIH